MYVLHCTRNIIDAYRSLRGKARRDETIMVENLSKKVSKTDFNINNVIPMSGNIATRYPRKFEFSDSNQHFTARSYI